MRNNKISGYHTYKPVILRCYNLTAGNAPKINVINNDAAGVNSLVQAVSGFENPNIKIIGNTSLDQDVADVYNQSTTLYKDNAVTVANNEYERIVTFDPPAIPAGGQIVENFAMQGVDNRTQVFVSFSNYNANIEVSAVVSVQNTVAVRFKNVGSSEVDLSNGSLYLKRV